MAEAAGTRDAAREAGAERSFRLLLLALCLVGAALRSVHLDTTLSHDEVETVRRYVEGGPDTILATHGGYGSTNNHLLNSLLAWGSVRAFGLHVWSLRLPSWLFGVLAVPLVGLVARALLRDRLTAAVAAFLAAFSPVLVAYAPACRGYGPLVFFALAALWCLLGAIEDGATGRLPLAAAALVLCGWSHMTGLAFAGTCGLALLVRLAFARGTRDPSIARRRPLWLALASVAAAGLLLVAWYSRESLILRDVQSRVVHGTFVDPSLSNVKSVHYERSPWPWMEHVIKEFLGARSWPLLAWVPALLAGLPLALRRDPRRGATLACFLLFPPAALLAANLKLFPRYFLFVQPFALVAAGVSVAWAARALASRAPLAALRRPALAGACLALALEATTAPWLLSDLRGPGASFQSVRWDIAGTAGELAAALAPEDVVLSFPRPEVRGDWHEWAFSQSWAFHEELSLAPILAAPLAQAPARRTLWYVTPERAPDDDERFPPGAAPRFVAERWGSFLFRAELLCEPPALLPLPALEGSLGAWRFEDPFENVDLRFAAGDVSLAVGHAGGDARVLSPRVPVEGGSLVELADEVAAEQSDGVRPCATIGLSFFDAEGALLLSVSRRALPWPGLAPTAAWQPLRLTTVAPRGARSVEVCLSLAPAHPAGSVVHFRPPVLRAAAARGV